MKNKALTLFAALVIVLQLAFPSYYLADAVKREDRILTQGNEYIIDFNYISIEKGKNGYKFFYDENTVENPNSDFMLDYLYNYYEVALKKDESGKTLFYNPHPLSQKELKDMDILLVSSIDIEPTSEEYEFTGIVKNEEDFYNLIVSSDKENGTYYDLPDFAKFSSSYQDFYAALYRMEVKGSLKIKVYDGALKVTEISIGDNVVLKIKE